MAVTDEERRAARNARRRARYAERRAAERGERGDDGRSLRRRASNPRMSRQASLPGGRSPLPETKPTLTDLLDEATWLEWRAAALPPSTLTTLHQDDQTRAEFVAGARLLRLDAAGKFVLPHQLLIADVINAGAETNAVLVPRRSAKTTSVIAVIAGRCAERDDYLGAMTLTTTATKSGARFNADVLAPILRRWPNPKTRPLTVYRGKGSESVSWENGSSFGVRSPVGDAFRSDAYDIVLVDEAGEASPEQGEDLNSAIYPSFDTRDGAQVVLAGTAGDYRKSLLLWDALEDPDAAKIAYAWPDDLHEDDRQTWEQVQPLIRATHPGIHGGLTTLEKMRTRFDQLGPTRFAREYGGIFGEIGGASLLFNRARWSTAGVPDGLPQPPERFRIAFAPHPDTGETSIIAAWRDDQGRAVPLLLEQVSLDRAAQILARYWRKYRTPLVYDVASQNAQIIVQRLSRTQPRPKTEPLNYAAVKQAATIVVDDVENGRARWYRAQTDLSDGVLAAAKRRTGDKAWLIGRPPKAPETNVTAAEAWSYAQYAYDTQKTPSRGRGRVVT